MKSEPGHDARELMTLDQWREWRERCAALLCAPECASALHLFGFSRFKTYALRLNRAVSLPSAADCWHLFESHLALRDTREGKCAKQWLFERTRDPDRLFDAVQGGASLMMRDVVRAWIACEAPPSEQVSLDTIAPGTDVPLGALIAGAVQAENTLEEAEQKQAEYAAARAVFAKLPDDFRRVLALRSEGLSLNHPDVTKQTGVSRSTLYKLWQDHIRDVAEAVKRLFPEESTGYQRAMAMAVLELLKNNCKKITQNAENADLESFVLVNPNQLNGGSNE